MNDITAAQARDLLRYDPETGKLYWLGDVGRDGKIKDGTEAGYVSRAKSNMVYRKVNLNGRKYFAHRLIWLIVTGRWPTGEVNHIDGNSLNNRWSNLRDVPRVDVRRNQKRCANNTSGVTGVYWHRYSNKWRSRIQVNGTSIHLGCFDSLLDAAKARKAAERKYGFHETHGREA